MKKNYLRILIFVIFISSLAFAAYSSLYSKNARQGNTRKTIVTSFYPIYYFASEIAGDKLAIHNLTPAGAEPHEYELTTGDIITIEKSSALLINGGGFEPWVGRIRQSLENKSVKIIDTGEGLFAIEGDPHIWLSPLLAARQSENIFNVIAQIDPGNIEYYEKNYQSLKGKLFKLDTEMRNGLGNCRLRTIVTSHDAFGYIVSDYGLKQMTISGLSPEEEPTPKKLAEVADFAKNNKVEYIFFETLVSPRLADTIAKEVKAKTLVFNPLEGLTGEEIGRGEDYFSIQEKNLTNIKIALSCENDTSGDRNK